MTIKEEPIRSRDTRLFTAVTGMRRQSWAYIADLASFCVPDRISYGRCHCSVLGIYVMFSVCELLMHYGWSLLVANSFQRGCTVNAYGTLARVQSRQRECD